MSQLVLNNVKKAFGEHEVIKGVDMQIEQGDFCVFVGPSGCGKSTLLRMISGLESITGGEISIGGNVVNDVPAADRGLAMVFQSYALYPHMSVRQNLTFGLENMRTSKAEIKDKVAKVAKMLQIEDLLDRKPKALSGGQRQRVAIGRAVVREPSVFLFDEPLSNLDAELRVEMRREIARLHRDLQNTMIYVTHDQVEAMTMADKIAVLRSGQVEQFGRPLDIYNRPHNMFVAGFIGSPRMNFVAGRAGEVSDSDIEFITDNGERIAFHTSDFDVPANANITIGFRPNHLSVSQDRPDFQIKVHGTEQLGGESFIYAKTSKDEAITVHLGGQTDITLGTEVGITIHRTHLHVFDTETGKSLRRSA